MVQEVTQVPNPEKLTYKSSSTLVRVSWLYDTLIAIRCYLAKVRVLGASYWAPFGHSLLYLDYFKELTFTFPF